MQGAQGLTCSVPLTNIHYPEEELGVLNGELQEICHSSTFWGEGIVLAWPYLPSSAKINIKLGLCLCLAPAVSAFSRPHERSASAQIP